MNYQHEGDYQNSDGQRLNGDPILPFVRKAAYDLFIPLPADAMEHMIKERGLSEKTLKRIGAKYTNPFAISSLFGKYTKKQLDDTGLAAPDGMIMFPENPIVFPVKDQSKFEYFVFYRRTLEKKERYRMKGPQPHLWGKNNINHDEDHIHLTSGIINGASLIELGYSNVIATMNGHIPDREEFYDFLRNKIVYTWFRNSQFEFEEKLVAHSIDVRPARVYLEFDTKGNDWDVNNYLVDKKKLS